MFQSPKVLILFPLADDLGLRNARKGSAEDWMAAVLPLRTFQTC
jgi:hypothetical protein